MGIPKTATLVIMQMLAAGILYSQAEFGASFKDETCRFDYVHTGTKGSEQISLDKIRVEGAWPGSCTRLVDTLNFGEYQFRIFAGESDRIIFSRGFSSIFNEWQTTDEAARGAYRAFGESVRFPLPLKKARLEIFRRNKAMTFEKIFSAVIDPSSIDIVREEGISNEIGRAHV